MSNEQLSSLPVRVQGRRGDGGFSLVEAAIASLVLLVVSGAIFTMLARTQQDAAEQSDIQAVVESTRHGLDTVCRYVRQAGNDPLGVGVAGIDVLGPTEVRLRADVTGSAGPSNPDKGDPDGDTLDAGEDVTVRYDPGSGAVEVQSGNGSSQAIANNISAFSLQYFDGAGGTTTAGSNVRRVRVDLTGTSPVRSPRTGRFFSWSLGSDVQIAARQ